jgi:hypothetical protein
MDNLAKMLHFSFSFAPDFSIATVICFVISRGIGGQFRITQRSALSNLYENSCCRCKQTISHAEQLTCQFKAFVDLQYFLIQLCCLSLIKLHIVQEVNNVQICLIPAFSSLTTRLGRCDPNVCTAETGSQLLTATSYRRQ